MATGHLQQGLEAYAPPTDEAVIEQVERIVSHELFSQTTRLKRFLIYIVTEALAGRADRLKGYSIGLEVFDRSDTFDSQSDTIVRVQAGQMRRRLDLYYSQDGRRDPIRIVVPKGTYAPKFVVQDTSPKLVVLPPQAEQGSNPTESRRAPVIKDERDLGPSIAVLTFTNLSGEDDKFFAEGMTSEIINALIKFRFLRVMARTATIDRTLSEIDVREIGRTLGADYILTGNIRRAGDLVRVTADLINVKTREHVFNENYDRRLITENLLQIQEDIASYVAAHIGSPTGFVNRLGSPLPDDNLEITAYESILRFYGFMANPDIRRADKILADLRHVTGQYPDCSSAWAALSMMLTAKLTHDLSVSDAEIEHGLEEAFTSAKAAIDCDSQNALAYHAMFSVCFHRGNLRRYEDAAKKAIALNPNDADLIAFYAVTQTCLGNVKNAEPYFTKALALNPRPPSWYGLASISNAIQKGDYKSLIDHQSAFMDAPPFWSQLMIMACHGLLNNAASAQDIISQVRGQIDDPKSKIERTLSLWQINPALRAILMDGLAKVGLFDPAQA